ncbi:hypothetical protein TNCT_364601 [Trichonephila clavata]|uniref:Uncharacterized protein n=1 Tax=Trichonephila clavata TaxID=2740835 RepID=A0A8X6HTQ7_TRICU|nr:hypothetical protein TNCT_364601 [Trichonephila clavata]
MTTKKINLKVCRQKEKLRHSEEHLKLLKQIAARKAAPQNEPYDEDLFLDLWRRFLKKLPRTEQSKLRTQITNLISNAELKNMESDASPACSTARE